MNKSWALLRGKEVLNYFQVNEQEGLREKEAKRRLFKNGLNSLKEKKKLSPAGMFLNQLKELMAFRALRNIAVAWKELSGNNPLVKEPDSDLVFLGVLGMQDLP